MITPEDEKRYNLKPLPVVSFIGRHESILRNKAYEAGRRAYRLLHPHAEKRDEP